ncbi:hypothetical protein BGZ82_001817, partial [Podila clonocystis]
DGDVKEGTTAEKPKARKTKAGAAPISVDSLSGATGKDGAGTATTTGRKRTTKPSLPVVPESEKDEPMLDAPETETAEDPDASVPKSRRKRTASRSEAGNADIPSTGTSFRALYSREPPSASNSPALSNFSPTDSGQFSGQSNADGVVRRPNFSSYWSRQEKLDFVRLLSQYGKDWDRIAKALKTKTQIQVRNHFSNNADKLIADGVIGIDVVSTSAQDQGEPSEQDQDTSRASFGAGYANHEYPPQYATSDQSGGPGPRPGYFMPPSTSGPDANVPAQRETRSMTPPRRATNIGNLLNNNDEDVHVAVEDWFGNSEESGSQDAEDEVPENGGQMPVSKPRDVPHDPRFNETRRRDMDEDVETEDEFDRPQAQETQKAGVRGYPSVIGQRRMSEGAPMPHHYPANPSAPDYYGRHPQPVQHPQGTSVLGSPYGQQYYGPHGGYGSPPLAVTAPQGNHVYQRMHSPPIPMSSAPSSIISQPHSHHLPHQHQRSSSVSHGEMIPRSHPSPQLVSRARSPNPHQGPYFGQHHYAHPPAPSPVPGPYSQHRHSQSGQSEVLSPHPRPIGDTHMMHHPLPTSSGHVPMGHSGPSRYSSSPQLPGSGSTMRGSPGAGNGSPAHLGHGSSRYSPAPVVSPMANESSMHHLGQQQSQYQQHHRRSSSPFQHHVPGHVPSPSYLHAPIGGHNKPSSTALPYSSSHGAALLPPPLPVSGPASSELSPGPSYHGHRASSQQYSPGYGHHSYQQPPQQHHGYVEHSGGMPPSSSAMPHHARPRPSGPPYHTTSSSGRHTHGSTSS